MVRNIALDDSVRGVLATVEWDGNLARLTCGQLDRKTYQKVNDVLESLGGKWNRKAKAHLFDGDASDALESVIETGAYVSGTDLRQFYGEFETPDELADAVVERLALHSGMPNVLEPSAGSGQLLRAIRRRYGVGVVHAVAVEIQNKRRDALRECADAVHIADFLSLNPDSLEMDYDYVVMNPPFGKQADIDHVLHAWRFLVEGGRLVAIMSAGWTFRENRKSRDFRAFVEQYGAWEKNPEDAFKASGTMVNTVTVVLDKH